VIDVQISKRLAEEQHAEKPRKINVPITFC
jgi:hypothetical protein